MPWADISGTGDHVFNDFAIRLSESRHGCDGKNEQAYRCNPRHACHSFAGVTEGSKKALILSDALEGKDHLVLLDTQAALLTRHAPRPLHAALIHRIATHSTRIRGREYAIRTTLSLAK